MGGHLTRRMLLASAALALVVAGAYLVLLASVLELRASADRADRARATIAAASRVQALVVDLETGVRGYQATGDTGFLEPWNAARRRLPGRLDTLAARAAAEPAVRGRAAALVRAARRYLDEYSVPLVRAERTGPLAPARRLAAVADGKRRVDAIRALTAGIVATETAVADARRQRAAAHGRRAIAVSGAAIALSVLLVLLLAGQLSRTVVNPVRRLVLAAERVAAGDLSARVPGGGAGEVGALAEAFNDMAASVEASQRSLTRALTDLQLSDARFRAAIDAGSDALFVVEAIRDAGGAIVDFRFVDLNRRAEAALGVGRGEIVGRALGDVFPGERWDALIARYAEVAESGVAINEEFPVPSPDGHPESWWYHHVAPFGDGVAITTREVTERRRAEDAVRARDARHAGDMAAVAEIMRQLPRGADGATARRMICEGTVGVCGASSAALLEPRDGGVLAATASAGGGAEPPAVALASGTSPAAEAFRSGTRAFLSGPDAGAIVWQPVIRGDHVVGVLQVGWAEPAAELEPRAAAIVHLLAGEAAVALERADFVAELAGLNRVLEMQLEALRVSDQMKTDFVSSVSHELRTPLTAILGYLDVLRDDVPLADGDRDEFLDIVDQNARRLLMLIDDLLTLAGLEAGRSRMRLQAVDLRALVAAAVRDVRPAAGEKGHTVTVAAPDAPVPVLADAARFGQVLANLLANAVKFTPPGGRVEVTVAERDGAAALAVTDTGIGIPADQADYLFERFFRARNATRAAIPGTGLGLAIARTIVEAHDGRIAVASEDGAGATFTVTLPLARPAVAAA